MADLAETPALPVRADDVRTHGRYELLRADDLRTHGDQSIGAAAATAARARQPGERRGRRG